MLWFPNCCPSWKGLNTFEKAKPGAFHFGIANAWHGFQF